MFYISERHFTYFPLVFPFCSSSRIIPPRERERVPWVAEEEEEEEPPLGIPTRSRLLLLLLLLLSRRRRRWGKW